MKIKLIFVSICDLINRYRIVFNFAWKNRRYSKTYPHYSFETQFLPAALALQETPVSPAPRLAIWIIIAFAALCLVWSIIGQIDVIATAQGKIIPNDRIKTVQSFETAVVRKIYVSEGHEVKTGDVLVELDDTAAKADEGHVNGDLIAVRLQISRGQAILLAISTNKISSLIRPAGLTEAQYSDAQHLLDEQINEFFAKLARIGSDVKRREAELISNVQLVRKLEQTLPIVRQRAIDFKNLADQNFVSKHGFLEREQIRIEHEADLANLKSRLNELAAGLDEVKGQKIELIAETRRAALDSIADGQQKRSALEQDLVKAESRGKLLKLYSPVNGTVQQLILHTVGGVVTPAQPLMVIVPRDKPLEIEAYIENKDIGFLTPNQDAEIKVDAFQYSKYGTIPAKLVSISHDAINDEKRGLVYLAKVAMDKDYIIVNGIRVKLNAGMAVAVEIKTGKRRVIEYFLSPFIEHVSESLRER